MAELSYMSCAWDMYSILSSTGIMYNALTPSNRTLAALMSFAGTMFAAVIQGAFGYTSCTHKLRFKEREAVYRAVLIVAQL